MYLQNEQPPAAPGTVAPAAAAAEDTKTAFPFFDIFRRDIFCWTDAIIRSWKIFAIVPVSFMVAFFLFRTFTTPKLYVSNCSLIRQEITDPRRSGLPAGFVVVPRNVIVNLILRRTIMKDTIERLGLPYSSEGLYNMLSVKPAQRNSNYFILSATSGNPEEAAKIANTVAEVFIEDYKKLIRANLESAYESQVNNQHTVSQELNDLQQQLNRLYSESDLNSIEEENSNNNQRILLLEDRITQDQNRILALRSKIFDFEAQLKTVPETTVIYEEKNVDNEKKLVNMVMELRALQQKYTDNNPRVIAQKELVRQMEIDEQAKKAAAETSSKVVIGKNAEYTALQTDVRRTKAEITFLECEIKGYTEKLITLRTRREMLNKLAPRINDIEEKIAQKKKFLLQLEVTMKEIQLFLERSYSDIAIQEFAHPDPVSLTRKRGLAAIAGFMLGLVLSGMFVLGRELLNLTSRSRIDVEKALHLPTLGVIPAFSHEFRADFYSALQETISNIFDRVSSGAKRPHMIAVASSSRSDLDTRLMDEIYGTLPTFKEINYKIIRMTDSADASIAPHLINDFLYHFSEELPPADKNHTLYFKLDDLAFISPPSEEDLAFIRDSITDCDMVIWEIYDFSLHRQLFSEIARVFDLTVIPFKYDKTSKLKVYQMLQQLRAGDARMLSGLLYGVPEKNYRGVSI